jgi:hypothetical protein
MPGYGHGSSSSAGAGCASKRRGLSISSGQRDSSRKSSATRKLDAQWQLRGVQPQRHDPAIVDGGVARELLAERRPAARQSRRPASPATSP